MLTMSERSIRLVMCNNGTFDLNLKRLTDKQHQSVRFKHIKIVYLSVVYLTTLSVTQNLHRRMKINVKFVDFVVA
jgi:ABC-type lipoprotein export system ATPase subunit